MKYGPYNGLLDTDLYKLSIGQIVYHQYPDADAEYVFKCRSKDVRFTDLMIFEIEKQLHELKEKYVSPEKFHYLNTLSFLKRDYVDWLEKMSITPNGVFGDSSVIVKQTLDDPGVDIRARGKWVNSGFWELKVLPIVNEVYFDYTTMGKKGDIFEEGKKRLAAKVEMLKDYPGLAMAEFGTRRRFSAKWQDFVIGYLVENCPNLVGTSNVFFAHKYGIKPIGTMAHEYISAHLQLVSNIREAQKRAMYVWLQEYDGSLGIALTDTFTSNAFFRDFGKTLTLAFDGLRHDSGCPYKFGEKAIAHYESMGVDPRTKTLVFSDGLDIPTAIEIYKYFKGQVKMSFGIGTNLTNDMGVTPLNIVMKLIALNGKPVIKLSDNIAKAIGDMDMIKSVKNAYGIK